MKNHSLKSQYPINTIQSGFTLIEVLVALVILAVALTAIIHVTIEDSRTAQYIQQKSFGHWAAMYVVNDYISQHNFHNRTPPDKKGTLVMLNDNWNWQIELAPTADKGILKVTAIVSNTSQPQTIAEVTSYVAQ